MTALDRQIRLLSIFAVFTYPFACVPFLFFFFADHGIAVDRYAWIIACYYWAMIVMEVPTGVFADRFGRKSSLVTGSLFLAAGFVVIYQGGAFADFCGGEILLGIGHSLLSGAPTAMLFDSLRDHGREAEFLRLESRIHSLRLLGTGASFLVGGVLAYLVGIGPTILLTAVLTLVGAGAALFLREGRREHLDRPPILRTALTDFRSKPLIWVLIYFIILFGLLRFAFHTYQPYFQETVFDEENRANNWLILGVVLALLNLVAAPCSRMAPGLARRFRFRAIFTVMLLGLVATFFVMYWAQNWLGVALFAVHQVPFGLHWGLIQDFVNKRVRTVARATALSILSFAGRTSFAAWFTLIGVYQREHGTPRAYLLLGIVGTTATVLWCAPGLGVRLLNRHDQDSELQGGNS